MDEEESTEKIIEVIPSKKEIEQAILEQEKRRQEDIEEQQRKIEEEEMFKRTELARKNWAAYKSIEEDLLRVIEYIPLETRQYEVYSFKIADLIIRSCTQIESIFKEIIREGLFLEEMQNETYQELIKKIENGRTNILSLMKPFLERLNLKEVSFTIRNNGDRLFPFGTYFVDEKKEIPFWWTIYNHLKHDFSKNLPLATLRAACCSLGALFILVCIIPRNQEYLILNDILTSPNISHIGDFLTYMKKEEKKTIYSVIGKTSIFEFWLLYNPETIGVTFTRQMHVGDI